MTIENKIKRVRELDQAATPGPWKSRELTDELDEVVDGHGSQIAHTCDVDATLIAEYRTLAPELANELEEAQLATKRALRLARPEPYQVAYREMMRYRDEASTRADGLERERDAALEKVKALEAALAHTHTNLQIVGKDGDATELLLIAAQERGGKLEAEFEAFKAKQVDLVATAYDEGRNYVDDRGSEE